MNMKIELTKPTSPPRIVIYGVDGVGKSTFASECPKPVFIRTERGTENLSVPAFPMATCYRDVLAQIQYLQDNELEHRTLVIDSLDWTEKLLWRECCMEHGKNTIADFSFGKGYALADAKWGQLLEKLDALNESRRMMIVGIAHCKLERLQPPDSEGWNSYILDLHGGTASQKGSARIVAEWCDILGFADYDNTVREKEGAFGQKRARVTQGDRTLFLEKSAAFHAKNRYGLPSSLPLDWSELAKALKERRQQQQENVKE